MNKHFITPDQLAKHRANTPAASHITHLNNAGAALQPLPVVKMVAEHLELETQIGGYEAAAQRQGLSDDFYPAVAQLLQTSKEKIAYTHSSTDAYNRALSAIPFQDGDKILTTVHDYASNHIAFLQLRQRHQLTILLAPEHPAGGWDVEATCALIKKEQPKLVAVTHMPTSSGLIQDLYEVGATLRELPDCWYLVDACQTAGQLPLAPEELGCDFLTASFRKFLRGPRGAGFLYVSAHALAAGLEPQFPDLHSADWTSENSYQIKPDATRFEHWERNHAIVQGAAVAARYAHEVGIAAIAKRSALLAQQLREELQGMVGVQLQDRGQQLGAIVTCSIANIDPNLLLNSLRQANVHASIAWLAYARLDLSRKQVPWILRLSPHYYNTEEEIVIASKEIFKIIC